MRRSPTTLDELARSGHRRGEPHDFAPVAVKQLRGGGGVILPATYLRCVRCGYRVVEYWEPVFGKRDEFAHRREPV